MPQQTPKNTSTVQRLIDAVSAIFLPVVGLMSGCGLLHGILSLLLRLSVLSSTEGTYRILYAAADAPLYFLPVLLGVTAAKKIGANPITAAAVGCFLLYPTLSAAFEGGETLSFLSLPVPAVIYHSGVIPILFSVFLQKYLEKLLKKLLPDSVHGIFIPIVSLVLCALAVLLLFGPVGAKIGEGIAFAYEAAYTFSPLIAGILLGGSIQLLVMFGFHWPLLLTAMNNIALHGFDTVTVLMAPAVLAQAGAALAVCCKTQKKGDRALCLSAAVSSFFGVTESAMFGVNLPRKRPMLFVLIGGAVGGAVAGISGASASAFALPSAVSLPVFLGDGFMLFLISCGIGLVLPFLLTLFFYHEKETPVPTDGKEN